MADNAKTPKPKTAAVLKAEYDRLVKLVQETASTGRKLELKLLEEVKKKVREHAGDLEDLMHAKRAAFAAYERQAAIETNTNTPLPPSSPVAAVALNATPPAPPKPAPAPAAAIPPAAPVIAPVKPAPAPAATATSPIEPPPPVGDTPPAADPDLEA
jgi:hypothetical protein